MDAHFQSEESKMGHMPGTSGARRKLPQQGEVGETALQEQVKPRKTTPQEQLEPRETTPKKQMESKGDNTTGTSGIKGDNTTGTSGAKEIRDKNKYLVEARLERGKGG